MVLFGLVEAERGRGARRRARAVGPRRRRLVVRYSEEEFAIVAARAGLAGLAVGGWVGQIALDAAQSGEHGAVGLPDLLRLHADVTLVARLLDQGNELHDDRHDQQRGDRVGWVAALLERLDLAIDAVVAAAGASVSAR